MGWGRLDDGWHGHPKLLAAGLIATAIQSKAISYCGHYLTDGYLPAEAVPALFVGVELLFVKNGGGAPDEYGGAPTPAARIDWPAYMVANRLWEKVSNRPGYPYKVHDYLDFNPSRTWLEAERERKKARGEAGARARWEGKKPTQSLNDSAPSIATSTVSRDAPTQPIPSPKGEGSSTFADKYNPLESTQRGEVLEGASEANASPFRGKNLDDLSFEDFYTYYPVRVGEDAARRAYKRVTRGKPDVKRAIFLALAAQLTWGKKFWPNPARWLSEGRWKDASPSTPPQDARALTDLVRREQVRELVAGLADDLQFKPPPGQASAEGEGRSR